MKHKFIAYCIVTRMENASQLGPASLITHTNTTVHTVTKVQLVNCSGRKCKVGGG